MAVLLIVMISRCASPLTRANAVRDGDAPRSCLAAEVFFGVSTTRSRLGSSLISGHPCPVSGLIGQVGLKAEVRESPRDKV